MVDIDKMDNFMRKTFVEPYRVGGSVRDSLLGRTPKDPDYVVRGIALPDVYERLSWTGERFSPLKDRAGRPLGVRLARGGVEITLPRKEVSTGPGHRDFDIVLDPELPLIEDAKRRDFTFNALYRPLMDGYPADFVADPTSTGLYDLQHRLIRTTHPDSFRDDPLRILRALRFVSVLGYDLSTDTAEQMAEHADAVTGLVFSGYLSGTVYEEMCKILMGDHVAGALRIMAKTGTLGTLFPGLAPMVGFDQGSRYHDMTTDEHTFTALATAAKVEAPLRVRWALLFHDSGKPETAWTGKDGRKHYYAQKPKDEVINAYDGHLNLDHEEQSEYLWRAAAEAMNVPRELREDVARMVREHMVSVSKPKWSKVVRDRIRFGDEFLRDLHMHRMCDLSGKGSKNRNHLVALAAREETRRKAEALNVPRSAKDLAVTGQDAKELGLEGRRIGDALATVLDEVACDPTEQKRSREWQMRRLEAAA